MSFYLCLLSTAALHFSQGECFYISKLCFDFYVAKKRTCLCVHGTGIKSQALTLKNKTKQVSSA